MDRDRPYSPASSPAALPRPLPATVRGTNIGFIAFGLALVLCSSVGMAVVGFHEAPPGTALLEVPGVAWVDGVGYEGDAAFTRTHLVVPDARFAFARESRPCVFLHGERVRVLSEHDGALHAESDRCSAWLPSGWLSGTRSPALGLLK